MSLAIYNNISKIVKRIAGMPGLFSRTLPGVVPAAPSGTGTDKFIREDGAWAIPLGNFVATSDVTISSVTYHTYWEVAPTASNQVYGVAIHPTNGRLCRIYNNKGTYSMIYFDVIKTSVAKTGTGDTVTRTIAADTILDNITGTLLNNDNALYYTKSDISALVSNDTQTSQYNWLDPIQEGDYFFRDGDLARALTLIDTGDGFIEDTNYEIVSEGGFNSLNADKAERSDLTNINITSGTTNNTGGTISSGTYFYYKGALVKAKKNISSGATLTLNTNYEVVTAGGLNALNSALAKLTDIDNTTVGGYVLYKIGTKVCAYNHFTDLGNQGSKLIGTAPSKYRPKVLYYITTLFAETSPYTPIGSVWIHSQSGAITVYKATNVTSGYSYFEYEALDS